MKKAIFFILSLSVLFTSCSPKITTSIQKTYTPLARTNEVKVLKLLTEVPQNAELLGKVDVGDTGFSSNCSYDTVLNAAMIEARKAGGNMICITNHLTPDFNSSCHRISANIYKIDSQTSHLTASISAPDSTSLQSKTAMKDTIEIIKKSLGYQYKYKGEMLSLNQLGNILDKNQTTQSLYKSAKGTSGFLNVLGFAGGFCIGYGLGPLLYGRAPNLGLAGIGAGILVISLPIVSSAENKLKKAVDIYNTNIPKSAYTPFQYEMKLAIISNGVGVRINF